MQKIYKFIGITAAAGGLFLLSPALFAQENVQAASGVNPEIAFILNSFSFLVTGILVMWMAAGFAMLESGLVRGRNTAAICLKNVALYSVAAIMYYVIGYSLMYVGVGDNGGWIGSLGFFYSTPAETMSALETGGEALDSYLADNSYAVMSDWFFQMVFVATAASIVSGTVAERIRIFPFVIFVVCLTGFIYPIQGAWSWGGGWLADMGFRDFAGSSIVHSAGGWAALVGALILGPRQGKYNPDGSVNAMPGANLPLATLGTLILWMGWFGFNGGSVLALDSAANANLMAIVMVNTNLAACAGAVIAMIASQIVYGKIDLTMTLNGAIAGLVSITAGPDLTNHLWALLIGGVGGVVVVLAVPFLDRMKIDDVVGAIPAHLFCGIWGTLAVGIFNPDVSITSQLIGIFAIGAFVVICSLIVWTTLKFSIGLRPREEYEEIGLDRSELGMEAYPEFGSHY